MLLEDRDEVMAIERLRISAIPARNDLLRANLVIQKLSLH
jgi:hypothetical protein